MKLGEIIKEYRLSHKESMGDFANKTGLSKTYISMLEKNRNTSTGKPVIPSIPTLTKCAVAMGMTLDDLVSMLDADQIIELPKNTTQIIQSKIDKSTAQETKKVPKELKKLLEDEEIALNGRMMSDEDKEKMMRIIEAAFYEAKEMNKRK